MKKWSDSKAFIPLIIIIFILLVVMAMTGCASTALTTAASEGQTPVIKDLLDKGADVNERGFGWTPLVWAVYYGHMEAAKVLVDRGADVNAGTDQFGTPPLWFAVTRGYANIAKLLIERGADIEYAMVLLKKERNKDAYELLERLAKRQQPPKYQAAPSTLPTALPLPTEPAAPF